MGISMTNKRQILFPLGLDSRRWIHPLQQSFPYLAEYWGNRFFLGAIVFSVCGSLIAYYLLWLLQPVKHPLWTLVICIPLIGWLSLFQMCANRWLVWQQRFDLFSAAAISYACCLVAADVLNGYFLKLVGFEYQSFYLLIHPWGFLAIVVLAASLQSAWMRELAKANEERE
jgi:hypothetical protein